MTDLERLSQMGIVVVATVAGVVALKGVAEIFAPMAIGLVAGVVASPLGGFWERIGLPKAAGALVTLALTLIVLGLLVLIFQPLVSQLVAQTPKVWNDMQGSIQSLRGVMKGLRSAGVRGHRHGRHGHRTPRPGPGGTRRHILGQLPPDPDRLGLGTARPEQRQRAGYPRHTRPDRASGDRPGDRRR